MAEKRIKVQNKTNLYYVEKNGRKYYTGRYRFKTPEGIKASWCELQTKQSDVAIRCKYLADKRSEHDGLTIEEIENLEKYNFKFSSKDKIYTIRELALEYCNNLKNTNKAPATARGSKGIINKYILSEGEGSWIDKPIFKVEYNDVCNWKEKIRILPVQYATKKKIYAVLRELYNLAYSKGEIYLKLNNFALQVPENVHKNEDFYIPVLKSGKPQDYWTSEEFDMFIQAIQDDENISQSKKDYYIAIFSLLYCSGMRINEMAALTWNDFDSEFSSIKVTKSVSEGYESLKKRDYFVKKTKTLVDRKVYMYGKYREAVICYYNQIKNSSCFSDEWFAFGNGTSQPLCARSLNSVINKYSEKAGLTRIKVHGFRHSCVYYLCHEKKFSREHVSNILGHKSSQMIDSVYDDYYIREKIRNLDELAESTGKKIH